MLRQPKWDTPIEDLREALRFAVPLRAASLAHQLHTQGYTRDKAATWLTSEAKRAGSVLGGKGDTLIFSTGGERTGRARADASRTTDDLVSGIAAAVLLAQLDGSGGVTVFGDHYGATPRQDPASSPAPDLGRVHQLLDDFEALITRNAAPEDLP
jgi:hypothetical protein